MYYNNCIRWIVPMIVFFVQEDAEEGNAYRVPFFVLKFGQYTKNSQ